MPAIVSLSPAAGDHGKPPPISHTTTPVAFEAASSGAQRPQSQASAPRSLRAAPPDGDAAILTIGQPDPINFRSVHEQRLAADILRKEGTWDEETQVYRTRQRQLQERSRAFADLQQALRYSPLHAYSLQAQDSGFVYPNAPAQLLKHHHTPHSMLSEVDPTPANVERKAKEQISISHERRMKTGGGGGAGGGGAFTSQKEAEEVITALERDLRRTAEAASKRDGSVSTAMSIRPIQGPGRGSNAPPPLSQPRASASPEPQRKGPPPLPQLKLDSNSGYSSLLMQLRKTRQAVEQHHKELSTVRSILTMEGSAEVKRTITRMFADPKNAEAISQEEHALREKAFEEERKRTLLHQTSLLKEEREAMERELAQLKM